MNTIKWRSDRPFAFFENGLSYQQYVSLYSAIQADNPRSADGSTRIGNGISRSFTTLRISPSQRVSFDINHNYFRDVPTFDLQLLGTGLLDKYLFQGLSAGVRVQTWRRLTLYTTLGRSNSNSDSKASWNQMYGIGTGPLAGTGIRADIRYSRYASAFGTGSYESLLISRNLGDRTHFEFQLGKQSMQSSLTSQSASRFFNATVDTNLSSRFFLQGGLTLERGVAVNYEQWSNTIGYRFDNHAPGGK
jgi:hypothetical protein